MQLTNEQLQIIRASGNLKINAVAGSGKTTTLIEYARSRPAGSKILYIAFNRSVRLEATLKFAAQGLNNVTVETAHSLAFRHIVPKHGYQVRAQGYRSHDLAELLKIRAAGEKHAAHVVANHISRLVTLYCNSTAADLRQLNYSATISQSKALAFFKKFSPYIQQKAQLLLEKMDTGAIGITHDFYLKKFQLARPQLPFDYVLFDEGQDASAAMLDVFLHQRAVKLIVGDTNQQIYGWRHAVNSLEKTDFTALSLSTSFRFGSAIARLARQLLGYKALAGHPDKFEIHGAGTSGEIKTRATIARSNLGLLLRAIQFITGGKTVERIFFEGNINSYTYADNGTSLYDILHLYNEKYHLVSDKVIRSMRSTSEVEEYARITEDHQLMMMVELVRKYGNEIPRIIKTLKEKHVSNEEKHKTEMIFSTVHRAKGMEYDEVHLADDFIKRKAIESWREDRSDRYTPGQLNEEINLLYVAVTRARVRLFVPESMLPEGYVPDKAVIVTSLAAEGLPACSEPVNGQAYTRADKRRGNRRAHLPWDREADEELALLVREGMKTKEIAAHFGRTEGAVKSRMSKLAL